MKVTVPMQTRGSNAREHHMQRHRRVKGERQAVAWLLNGHKPKAPPCTVTLTRLGPSPRGLDRDDNLPHSMKGVKDQVAQWLGIDDASPLVTWKYAQRREKAWAVEIEIQWPEDA